MYRASLESYRFAAGIVAIFALVLIAYVSGLPGGFVFDDYPNIVTNKLVNRESWSFDAFLIAALSGEAGPTGRPISMLSFALDSYFWDLNPAAMKWENILLHVAVAIFSFVFFNRLLKIFGLSGTKSYWISLIGVCLWAVHPLNLTSVLYIVQRMNTLSALFGMLALLFFIQWRLRLVGNEFDWLNFIGFGAAFALSVFSKENGVLVLLYVVLIEVFAFQRHKYVSLERFFRWFLLAALALVTVLIWYLVIANPEAIARGYGSRDFTVDQRQMTQFRVVAGYVLQLFSPALQEMSLYHDDISVSDGFFSPVTTLYSLIFLFALVLFAALTRKHHPLISLSIFVFFGSHLLESFTLGLEMAYEHRMYFGGLWLVIATVYGFSLLITKLTSPLRPIVAITSVVILAFLLTLQTQSRAEEWSSPMDLIFAEVKRNPGSYRANVVAGGAVASRVHESEEQLDAYSNYLSAMQYFDAAMLLKPNQASACIAALILETRYREREPDPSSVNRCKSALRLGVDSSSLNSLGLLVSCAASGKCTDGDYIPKLLDVAYDNFGSGGNRSRALLLADRASYYAKVKSDLALASLLLRRAIEVNPQDDTSYISLIDVLVRQGDLAGAREIARRLHEIDPVDKHQRVYEALEVDLK